MALDTQAQAVADAMAQWPPLDFASLSVADYRAGLAAFPPPPTPEVALSAIEDRVLCGPGGDLRYRLYRPRASGRLPLTVFFHGGGFVACGLDTHDNICRVLAARASTLVASVDYRLAPEHKFPAAVLDAVAAVRGLREDAEAIGADASRIAVAGDSAGGNLAAVAAQALRGLVCHQLLFYPVTHLASESASYSEFAHGPMLTRTMMRWFAAHYLPDAAAACDARASPLRESDLRSVAGATVITAECDPLRDEGEAYAQALRRAGVEVLARRWPQQFHGFVSLLGQLDAAGQALAFGAESLRQALDTRTR
jgi:acetyl esterase